MTDIDRHPEVQKARNRRVQMESSVEQLYSSVNDKLARLQEAEHDAADALLQGTTPKGLDRLRTNLEAERQNYRIAQRALERAEDEERQAREEARRNIAIRYKGEFTKKLREFQQALDAAAAANAELRRVYAEAQDTVGQQAGIEPLHWGELNPDTDSKYNHWRNYVATYRNDK